MTATKRNLLPAGLLLLGALVGGLYLYSLFLLQPFSAQTPRDVELAYLLRTWNPLLSLVVLAVVLVAGAWSWRRSRWLGRSGLVLALALASAVAWAARFNHFEQMFSPLEETRFAAITEVDHLTPEDMVLGVVVNGEARAWPVGMLAYHHIVNDEVGGVPLVATY